MEPPPKKAYFGTLLQLSSRYVWGADYPLRSSLAPPIIVPALKKLIFGRQDSYLDNSDHLSVSCTSGITPHLTLATLSSVSVGDPSKVPQALHH
jgi:hypothetical protein